MRLSLMATVAVAFASMAGELRAQYYQPQGQVRAPAYYYAAPTRQVYAPGYYTYAAPSSVRRPNPTGYQNRPYYGAYGYGFYSNGSTDGFPPFRDRRSR